MSQSVISFKGLTIVQVSQNQAAVVSDPQNHIFVVKNAGFVAYGLAGNYDVLAVVATSFVYTGREVRNHTARASTLITPQLLRTRCSSPGYAQSVLIVR